MGVCVRAYVHVCVRGLFSLIKCQKIEKSEKVFSYFIQCSGNNLVFK